MDKLNIKIETLTNNNYPIWEMQLEALLDGKGLFDDVILNDEPVKLENEPNSITKHDEWCKKNKEAYSLIILNISPDIAIIYKGIKNAKKIWYSLKERFEGEIQDKIMNMFLHLTKLKKHNHESIDQYIVRAQGLATEISQLGREIHERELVRYIVEGLSEKYNTITATLIANRGITLSHLRQILIDFEKKMEDNKPIVSAFRTTTFKGKKCFICNKTGHLQKECWYNPHNKRKNTKKGWNNSNKHEVKFAHEYKKEKELALFSSFYNVSDNKTIQWHLDSACTSHMTNDVKILVNEKECKKDIKTAEKERNIQSICEGDVLVSSNDYTNLKLEKVLCVPSLNGNLLSVSSIVKKGNKVIFDKNGVEIYSKDNDLLCQGNLTNGLFSIDLNIRNTRRLNDDFCFKTYVSQIDLWHKRLGHLNINYLHLLEKEQMVRGLDKLKGEPSVCESCSKGKMTRNKGSCTFEETTTKPLERLYVDLCGPMHVETLAGRKYMMIIIDEYSRRYFVELLYTKNEATKKLKQFIERRENELNLKVKKLRSDNGTEFINEELESYLKNKGIKHEKTIPYSPRSNGVAERGNRTILDMARTMLIDARLPLSFWGEAVNTAAYIYNVTPTKTKSNKTPMELWSKKKPSVKHFRVFGCKVIYKLSGPTRHKLEPKGKEGIHLGYSNNRKAYRIYSLEDKKVYETSDVTFNEKEFDSLCDVNESNIEKYNCIEYEAIRNPQSENDMTKTSNLEDSIIPDRITEENINDNKKFTENENSKRPSRNTRMPSKYDDYKVYIASEFIPETYEEATTSTEKEEWKFAMNEEINSFNMHEVWEPIEKPKDAKIIKCKWIYKVKNLDNEKQYKARLVAIGSNQKQGIDFEENFSPVMKWDSFRILLSLAAAKKSIIKFFDVKTAYLNGTLDKRIYMESPKGYELPENQVYLIKRSIYGLPQSGRCWYNKFSEILKNTGMKALKSDPSLFTKRDGENYIHIGIYVDDFIVVSNSEKIINEVIKNIAKHIQLKETTHSNMFLGIQIEKSENGIVLSQKDYTLRLLKKFNMQECNPVGSPGLTSQKILDEYKDSKSISQQKYQEAIGSLMYLAVGTRPDIAFAISKLSQYNKDPREIHWMGIKRLFRYLKGTINYGLKFETDLGKLNASTDAGWNTTSDAKSYSGYLIKLGNSLIGWKSGKQKLVALSTMEAELISACECTCAVRWTSALLEELGEYTTLTKPINIKTDSKALIDWIDNNKVSCRTRHINRKYHFIKDDKEQKIVAFEHQGTNDLDADILTKYLPKDVLMKHMNNFNLLDHNRDKIKKA